MAHGVHLFIDLNNIFASARDVARKREGVQAGREARLHFPQLCQLVAKGRPVLGGVSVGSTPSGTHLLKERLKSIGLRVETYELSRHHREQAVDQALQVHMLRAALDMEPGIAVLLTGDGKGHNNGIGFLSDLQRMADRGWRVEVASWRDHCHRVLRAFAEANGGFTELDKFYDVVTYIKGTRRELPLLLEV